MIVDPPTVAASAGGNSGEGAAAAARDQLEAAKASGDKSALLMFLQAQSSMLSQASAASGGGNSASGSSASNVGSVNSGQSEDVGLESGVADGVGGSETGGGEGTNSGSDTSSSGTNSKESEKNNDDAAKAAAAAKEEKAEAAAAAQGDIKVDQITAVLETGGGKVTDVAGAEIMSKTIETIIGKPAEKGEKTALGQEVVKKATSILEDLVGSMADFTEIADPEQLKPSVVSVTNTIGSLLDALHGMANTPDDESEETRIETNEDQIDIPDDGMRYLKNGVES